MKTLLTILGCCFLAILLFSSIEGFTQHTLPTIKDDSTKTRYRQAFENIVSMLEYPKPSSFKRAVFEVENAWFEGGLDRQGFQQELNLLTSLARQVIQSRELTYSGSDKPITEIHAALFTVMTDTLDLVLPNNIQVRHLPFRYDFEDIFGRNSWPQMFVSKLLTIKAGNCHSLPYLYKILAEEMGTTAHLALAPNHLYIKLRNSQSGWYNTELTSGHFPIDAWLMASGYVHLDAIQNGLYMDALTTEVSLALTLVDLAKGYQRKTGGSDPGFVLNITEKALEYAPNNINALLLKAEMMKQQFRAGLSDEELQNIKAIAGDTETIKTFNGMQQLYRRIYELGYREMPEEMYLGWLKSLETQREKYQNKKLPFPNN